MQEFIKNKKTLKIIAISCILLAVIVFALITVVMRNKLGKIPVASEAPVISGNKLTDEDIKNMVIPVKAGKLETSVSDETIKSLVEPVKKTPKSNADTKKNSNIQAVPVFISDDVLKGLVAPVNK